MITDAKPARNAIGMRAEGAEVAEKKGGVGAAARDVAERRHQRVVIRVDATDERDSCHVRHDTPSTQHV